MLGMSSYQSAVTPAIIIPAPLITVATPLALNATVAHSATPPAVISNNSPSSSSQKPFYNAISIFLLLLKIYTQKKSDILILGTFLQAFFRHICSKIAS